MNWSLGEIRALSVKAVRGYGMSWGLADDVGYCIEWLQTRGLPGVNAISDYLQIREESENTIALPIINGKNLENPQNTLCPIALGVWILDAKALPQCTHFHTYQPLLLLPFISTIATDKTTCLQWNNNQLIIATNKVYSNAQKPQLLEGKTKCILSIDNQNITNLHSLKHHTRVPDSARKGINILENFAKRTYAPESEASRLKGAGAGTTDND
jgi:hypothetical protein